MNYLLVALALAVLSASTALWLCSRKRSSLLRMLEVSQLRADTASHRASALELLLREREQEIAHLEEILTEMDPGSMLDSLFSVREPN